MRFIKFADQTTDPIKRDVADEDIIEGSPDQHVWSHFVGANETFKSGMWDCAAGVFRGPMNNQIEFCHIVEGEATIEIPGGETYTVKAGDSFVMDNGLQPVWHVGKYVRKHYVICSVPA